ncbi:hypothetical protein CRE_14158 [Caenorhabditis remanei]|uniref:ParB-like N-terminal domain-containing protein n=1 Tax=Caenorhabditis remanei TaxID=31234 RepID=E3MRK3_CAERE|nr:hypothetical protein CRE_14158 [Caenorhabditis remanei]
MYLQITKNETNVLLRTTVERFRCHRRILEGTHLIICHKLISGCNKNRKIDIDEVSSPINFYYDDNQDLFLTDFDEEEKVLELPIHLIAIGEEVVKIYFQGYLLNIQKSCMHKSVLNVDFYLKRSSRMQEVEEPRKKKARYVESQRPTESEISEELGIYTDSDSMLSITSDISQSYSNSPIETDTQQSDLSLDNPTPIRKVMPIPKSKLDSKTQHDLLKDDVKDKLNQLFARFRFPGKEQLIAPEALESTKNDCSSDKIFQEMVKEIKNTLGLGEENPIVVTEINGGRNMKVLSGHRRVQAYKTAGLNNIRVTVINPEEEADFSLYHFFSSTFKGRAEPHHYDYIHFFNQLFLHLKILKSDLKTWTVQDIREVFSQFLGQNDRVTLFIEICQFDELADALLELRSFVKPLSVACLMNILRRFKINPRSTLEVLNSAQPDMTESALRKTISVIQPDARHLLCKKGCPSSDAEELLTLFGRNPNFPHFVRGMDVRSNNKTLGLEFIKMRFESYLKKSAHKSAEALHKPYIYISEDNSNCDLFITDHEDSIKPYLDSTEEGVALLIGKHSIGATHHTIVLNDESSWKDEEGVLQNHYSLSLWCKSNGMFKTGRSLSDVFIKNGSQRKTIMSARDVRSIIRKGSIGFLNSTSSTTTNIASELLCTCQLILVPNEEIRHLLHESLSKNPSI